MRKYAWLIATATPALTIALLAMPNAARAAEGDVTCAKRVNDINEAVQSDGSVSNASSVACGPSPSSITAS